MNYPNYYYQESSWWDKHRDDLYRLVQAVVNASGGFFVDQSTAMQARTEILPSIYQQPPMSQQAFDAYVNTISQTLGAPKWKVEAALRSILGDQAPPKSGFGGLPSWVLFAGAGLVGYFLWQKYREEEE